MPMPLQVMQLHMPGHPCACTLCDITCHRRVLDSCATYQKLHRHPGCPALLWGCDLTHHRLPGGPCYCGYCRPHMAQEFWMPMVMLWTPWVSRTPVLLCVVCIIVTEHTLQVSMYVHSDKFVQYCTSTVAQKSVPMFACFPLTSIFPNIPYHGP